MSRVIGGRRLFEVVPGQHRPKTVRNGVIFLALLVAADWPGSADFGPYGRAGLATLIALVLFALAPPATERFTAPTVSRTDDL